METSGLDAAVEELKHTDDFLSEDLQNQLDRLREEHATMSNEREVQRDQLVKALLSNDKLRKDAEDQKELQESTAASNETEMLRNKQDKIEKLRGRLVERQQVSTVISYVSILAALTGRFSGWQWPFHPSPSPS